MTLSSEIFSWQWCKLNNYNFAFHTSGNITLQVISLKVLAPGMMNELKDQAWKPHNSNWTPFIYTAISNDLDVKHPKTKGSGIPRFQWVFMYQCWLVNTNKRVLKGSMESLIMQNNSIQLKAATYLHKCCRFSSRYYDGLLLFIPSCVSVLSAVVSFLHFVPNVPMEQQSVTGYDVLSKLQHSWLEESPCDPTEMSVLFCLGVSNPALSQKLWTLYALFLLLRWWTFGLQWWNLPELEDRWTDCEMILLKSDCKALSLFGELWPVCRIHRGLWGASLLNCNKDSITMKDLLWHIFKYRLSVYKAKNS